MDEGTFLRRTLNIRLLKLEAGPQKVNLELTRQWSLWASSHSAGPAGAEGLNGLNQCCTLHATRSALQARSAHWPAVVRLYEERSRSLDWI